MTVKSTKKMGFGVAKMYCDCIMDQQVCATKNTA
ncbi:hypothetical protein METHB2_960005 [Candidatus Methylobacter favarea]|uniref:Uncharacterized protein n=1 Tax=Candidatus Methylobacter favarea TaxID=2707345 RepID=A0A8S0XLW5_9GAMM|nr:hypothetical protein METHB2_960005 [Candidatus Methylobacter favarea]